MTENIALYHFLLPFNTTSWPLIKDAAAHLVDVLGSFKPRNPERHCPAPIAKPSEKKDSGFVFLTHPSDLFTHGVRLLIHMLKVNIISCYSSIHYKTNIHNHRIVHNHFILIQNSVSSGTPSDNIRGHLCVLLQCDWPQQKPEFLRVADEIKANKSFVYPCFFDYIISMPSLSHVILLCVWFCLHYKQLVSRYWNAGRVRVYEIRSRRKCQLRVTASQLTKEVRLFLLTIFYCIQQMMNKKYLGTFSDREQSPEELPRMSKRTSRPSLRNK
mgnify:CR=1 FL=1